MARVICLRGFWASSRNLRCRRIHTARETDAGTTGGAMEGQEKRHRPRENRPSIARRIYCPAVCLSGGVEATIGPGFTITVPFMPLHSCSVHT